MDDPSRFCCLNSRCPDPGKRGAGNLSVTSRYGPDKARRMLRCRAGWLAQIIQTGSNREAPGYV
jgi:hypothetical protein